MRRNVTAVHALTNLSLCRGALSPASPYLRQLCFFCSPSRDCSLLITACRLVLHERAASGAQLLMIADISAA